MKKLSNRERIVVALALLVFLGGMTWTYVWIPAVAVRAEVNDSIHDKKQQLDKIQELIRNKPRYEKHIEKLKGHLKEHSRLLFKGKDVTDADNKFDSLIVKKLGEYRIQPENFNPLPPVQEKNLATLSAKIELRTDLERLFNFLEALQTADKIIDVDPMSVRVQGDGINVSVSLIMSAYTAISDEEEPAEADEEASKAGPEADGEAAEDGLIDEEAAPFDLEHESESLEGGGDAFEEEESAAPAGEAPFEAEPDAENAGEGSEPQ